MAATYRIKLLAKALDEAGVQSGVLCTRAIDRPGSPRNNAARGVDSGIWFEYTPGSSLRSTTFVGRRWSAARGFVVALRRLRTLRRQGRLDCVYVYGYASNWNFRSWALAHLTRLMRIPLVTDVVELPWGLKEKPSLVESRTSSLAPFSGAVSISEKLEIWAKGECSRTNKPYIGLRVPALVDTREFPATVPVLAELQVLLSIAPEYVESVRFVRKAMESVWLAHPDCRLVVTGIDRADPHSAPILAAGVLDGDPRVVVAGYLSRADLAAAYQRSFALLAPLFGDPRSEARFPTKIAEYLAAGRPVVTSKVGEIGRILRHGVTAMLAEPGDAESFAECIRSILADGELAARVASEGRSLAQREFD
ncbi:MAG: hypothetical protein A2133_07225, partial [Actinobacteria bacterium RBG_16_64_13]